MNVNQCSSSKHLFAQSIGLITSESILDKFSLQQSGDYFPSVQIVASLSLINHSVFFTVILGQAPTINCDRFYLQWPATAPSKDLMTLSFVLVWPSLGRAKKHASLVGAADFLVQDCATNRKVSCYSCWSFLLNFFLCVDVSFFIYQVSGLGRKVANPCSA